MAADPRSRRRRRKKVLRRNDGSLYDATERRRISAGDLRDHVRDGGLFEARRQENGTDCTYEVLREIMGAGLLQSVVPGLGGGGPLAGLGALAGLAGGGPLAALGGPAGVAELVRAIGEQSARDDGGWDDWEETPRRSTRPSGGRNWAEAEWGEPVGRPEGEDCDRPSDPIGG